jgi:proteic killer suppression protein
MIQSFADETSADLFRERNTRHARAIPQGVWPVIRRKLKMLDVAAALDDLRVPPGNRLERLAGRRAGRCSIRINDQYRVTFKWEGGHAWHVSVEDYH